MSCGDRKNFSKREAKKRREKARKKFSATEVAIGRYIAPGSRKPILERTNIFNFGNARNGELLLPNSDTF